MNITPVKSSLPTQSATQSPQIPQIQITERKIPVISKQPNTINKEDGIVRAKSPKSSSMATLYREMDAHEFDAYA